MQAITTTELRALPPTVDLVTAARALGCGRTLAYTLAQEGRFPCRLLRLGNRYLVPTADLLRVLGVPPVPDQPAAEHAVAPARPTRDTPTERSTR
jgi:hypothetical protein